MKKVTTLMAVLAFILALSAPYAAAQDRDEKTVYAEFYAAYQAKDTKKAYDLAKEYLDKFPTGGNAAYMKTYRTKARATWFNEAHAAKNINDEIRVAKEEFAENGESWGYLYTLAIDIRQFEIDSGNYGHAAEGGEYIQKVIALIEGGKAPKEITPDKAKPVQAYLVQTQAMIEGKSKNGDKAIELYKKASSLDPANGILNAQNYLAIGFIYQERYQAASQEFEKLPEDTKKNADDPTTKAALDKINAQADLVLDAWARFLVLPDSAKWEKVRPGVETTVKDLYKFRHDDKMDGYDEWLAKYKAGTAANGSSSNGS
jgi:hypothetical protein